MQTIVWIAVAVAILVVVGLALTVVFVIPRQRSRNLRARFGPEYDRTVGALGDQRQAERELSAREQRRRRFEVRDLEPGMRARYVEEWQRLQAHFVDSPAEALKEADALVALVMRHRGYPLDDFEQAAADVSVDHPAEVEEYRAAHAISEASGSDSTDTETLRQGIQHYRTLFQSLVGEAPPAQEEAHGQEAHAQAREQEDREQEDRDQLEDREQPEQEEEHEEAEAQADRR